MQGHPRVAERLKHGVVVGLAPEAVEPDDRLAQVGVDVDGCNRDELESLVIDALNLLRGDLANELIDASRTRVLPGRLRATALGSGHSSHLRSVFSTCTSGWDHTNRSTSSMTSVA